ncbi:ABC transporter permease [Wenjunlia tyrosinilytica]|uniref:ABC transporter n=1 Tax=Wenjunlia tyrosinilytica TaxID=1544741 RepID=A0A917ZVA6_9ACTN|nr:ABC transporter permease [Wenjunlia tyrosinilytica]GGO95848.1 ABC transporter [Wenjunlia tyrosinilytica]
MFRTALRNVLAHKARLMMTALAVLLGVAFVSGTLIFSDSVGSAFRNRMTKSLADVAVSVDSTDGSGKGGKSALDARLADRIRALPGVSSLRASVDGTTIVADKHGNAIGNAWGSLGANYAPGPDGKDSRYPLKEGHAPANSREVALDTKTARHAGAGIGDTVRLATDGPVLTKKLVGIVTTDDPRVTSGGSLALFDTATAQRLFLTPGHFTELVVSAKPGADQARLTRQVQDVLPKEGAEARGGAELAAEQSRAIDAETRAIANTLLVFAGIALFVGIFIIANTFTMLIAQRTRELALLRAVGASRRQVTRSVLVEAGVLGLVASVAGLVLGLGIAVGLRSFLNITGAELPDGPLVVSPGAVLSSLAVGVAVTVLAAWLPSRKAAKIAPVEALSTVDQAPSVRSLRVRNAIGILLTALGVLTMLYVATLKDSGGLVPAMAGSALTMAGVIVLAPLLSRPMVSLAGRVSTRLFGVTGKLAKENALRNPRRTAATASALMIGLTLITGLTVAGTSANEGMDKIAGQDLTADYAVSMATFGGLSPDVAKKVAGTPGVAAAVPIRSVGFQIKGAPALMTGTDVSAIAEVTHLTFTSGSAEGLGSGGVAVSETTAKAHGWKVGDRAELDFYEGGKEHPRIRGIYADNDVVDDAVASTRLASRHISPAKDDKVLIKAAPGRAEGLDKDIKAALGGNPAIKVQDRAQLRREDAGEIDTILNMMYGLLGMAVVIAVVGVVNTLAMSVFERTREIGMLRAIGLARSGVKQMVRLESVVISLFGAALGIGLGIFLAWSSGHLLRSSFPQYSMTVPWDRIGLFVLIAIVVGVLAAVWPARRAARLNTLEAISAQ